LTDTCHGRTFPLVASRNTRRQTTTTNVLHHLSTLVLHGYARVSTAEQNPDAQRNALTRVGVHLDWLYLDRTSGAKSSRPVWDALCKALHSGDVLVATRLERVGRSTATWSPCSTSSPGAGWLPVPRARHRHH
jgi:Resolvase, N terminal domain